MLDQVGKGGFATVWRAWDSTAKRTVALKILHGEHARSEERRERVERGGRVLDRLDHPRALKVYEPEVDDGEHVFQVLAYMAGGDLRHAVLDGRLSGREALQRLLAAAEALEHAHGLGLVHRDVKPSNVLLDEQGRAVMADFNLARGLDTTGGTRTGALGTFLYAAPEQMNDARQADARADVYGLGMSAIFCLRGSEVPIEVEQDPRPVVAALKLPEALAAPILTAVAWRAQDRPAKVAALREALLAGLRGHADSQTRRRPGVKAGPVAHALAARVQQAQQAGDLAAAALALAGAVAATSELGPGAGLRRAALLEAADEAMIVAALKAPVLVNDSDGRAAALVRWGRLLLENGEICRGWTTSEKRLRDHGRSEVCGVGARRGRAVDGAPVSA